MIPSTCHFVWLGSSFPWLNVLAVVSAARQGGFERIVLHADEAVARSPHFGAIGRLSNFELRTIDLDHLAEAAHRDPGRVRSLYDNMTAPAARSDVLRALVLVAEGGVYLDVDTVTVASFDRLRSHRAFVGQELICFPEWSTRRPPIREQISAHLLSVLRFGMRLAPGGYAHFARWQHLYRLAVNNAVLGAEPGHPWMAAYLDGMLQMPPEVSRRRYAIGPDLLARVCRGQEPGALAMLGPRCFYPLPPVISEHWWRTTRSPDLGAVLDDETVVVHWYASVRSRKLAERVNADYVRRNAESQLFSRLAERFLPYI